MSRAFPYLGMIIHQSYFLVALAVGVILGTLLGLVFHLNFFASPLWLAVAGLLLIFAYLRPRFAFLVLALVAGFLISFFRIASDLKDSAYIRQFYDQTVTVTGEIASDPETDDSTTKLKLRRLQFGEGEPPPLSGQLYLTLSKNESLARSDFITVSGKLSAGFGTFSGSLYRPKLLKHRRPEPGDLVLKVRDFFATRISLLIPHEESSLGLSYLLGMKTNLDDTLDENLRTIGLVHIVVASGAHLAILVEISRRIFGRFSRFSGLFFSILFILFFMAMVGFTPSILRAGVMSLLSLLAWFVGRKIAPWRLILIVAAFTLILNPNYIIDLGWLLSFASFFGIMILGPRLTRFFYGDRRPRFIASAIITTISATLMTLPITLYYFGAISLISVFANLLILPTLPYAMGLTFLTGVFADLPFLNSALSFLTTKLLDFHIFLVNLFATQKSFLIQIEPYQPLVFLVYLAVLLPLFIGLFRQKVLKSKLNNNNNKLKREKICQDIVNGPLPNAKKP